MKYFIRIVYLFFIKKFYSKTNKKIKYPNYLMDLLYYQTLL